MSGPEKLKLAKERKIAFPPQLAESLETLPSLLEGVAESPEYHVHFGLGHEQPVTCLYVTPRGNGAELEQGLSGLEADAGSAFVVSPG